MQELSTVSSNNMYQSVCTVWLKTPSNVLSHDNWQHFPLKAVDGRAAYYCLGDAVPKLDGREEGSFVDLGSSKRYMVVESMASNRAVWYEVDGGHIN